MRGPWKGSRSGDRTDDVDVFGEKRRPFGIERFFIAEGMERYVRAGVSEAMPDCFLREIA